MVSSQYYFNNKLALSATEKTFKLIANNIANELKEQSNVPTNILKANLDNENFHQKISFNYEHSALQDMIQILKINSLYAIYFTHEDGAFYEVINMHESPELYTHYKASKEARWLIITSINNKTQYTYLNKKSYFIAQNSFDKKFDPHSRSWYKDALKTKESIVTEPYLFSNLNQSGVTYAQQSQNSELVLGIDQTSKNLNKFLASQKYNDDSEVFIFNQSAYKIASSNQDTLKNKMIKIDAPLIQASIQRNTPSTIKYTVNNVEYFAMTKRLRKANLFLGIKIESAPLLKPYIDNLEYSLSIALLLLLLSIPIIFIATNLIVRPIYALIVENEKIKHRDFQSVSPIKSHIIEFIELSDSLVTMSKSIQSYQKSQEEMLDSIVKLIAEAVDAKSPYTGGHCARVPEIAELLVEEASRSNEAPFKAFKLDSPDERREFQIGAWLHDCGKVTTPEYVVDKSTKLETINDRIHEIRTRFEVLWRDTQIEYLQTLLNNGDQNRAKTLLEEKQVKLIDDFNFIASTNIGGEFMSPDKQERVKEIANQEWLRHFDDSLGLGEVERLRYDHVNASTLPATEKLLSDKKQHIIKREHFDYEAYEKAGFKGEVPEHLYNYGEVYNLCVAKGTLSDEERYKINEHVIMSIKMLEKIPFPSNMTRIPEYAGTHHETLVGTGYPRKLRADELSIPARIMAIADVFEALTASDRPYKKAKTLSESIKILSFMVKDQHLDEDLFKLFLSSGLHLHYAKAYLKDAQIDDVDITQYL